MEKERPIYEEQDEEYILDPDETPIQDRKLDTVHFPL